MNTEIISLSISNLNNFDDEKIISDYFEKIDWVNVVTVNVVDRNIIVSGKEISREKIISSLDKLGYKVV